MVWGAVGPRKFFAPGTPYRPLLWFFLLGFLLPIAVYGIRRAFPKARWLRRVHVPLLLGGLGYIPPASGTNYGAWAIVGLLFGLLIKKKRNIWWNKYNFVLSASLDCSTGIAGILIFFAVVYTGASKNLAWWGTKVHMVRYLQDSALAFTLKLINVSRTRATGRPAHTWSLPKEQSWNEG